MLLPILKIIIIVVLFGIHKELRLIRYIMRDIQQNNANNSNMEEKELPLYLNQKTYS